MLRKIQHAIYLALMKFMSRLQPGASHLAFTGAHSSRQLCDHIAATGVSRVLVVTDKPLRELGVVDQAVARLVEAGVELHYYDGVLPDPTYAQVAEGAALYRETGCQAVFAIGGGSSMDAAKIIAAASGSDEDPQSWVGHFKFSHQVPPIYAIPTTSGTGSEATMGAVISDTATHEKGIIASDQLLPAVTALDPELILGLPPHITAATGMDALTHGIEAYIGVWERGTRSECARIAVKLVFQHLETACRDGSDREARQGLAMGAYYGGLAINQVNVGNVHAIAHQLGGKYSIPHGLANSLVLPHVLEFCLAEAAPRLAELARLVGAGQPGDSEEQLARAFIKAVCDLRAAVGITGTSDRLQPGDFDHLAELALAEGMGYPVPRLLDEGSVKQILARIAA